MIITLISTTYAQATRASVTVSPLADDPSRILTNGFNLLLGVIFGVAVFAVVVGGYQIMMSQGEPAAIEKGKKTITAAIVGLIIIMIAEIILRTTVNCTSSLFSITCLQ